MRTAVYPGSFDPVTLGHLDIISRAAAMFDQLNVTVMINTDKTPLFLTEERVKMLRDATGDLSNVEVDSYNGLLINYCREKGIRVAIRGLRAVTDFESELQMAQLNKELSHGELDTLFLTTDQRYAHLSSSNVKEIARFDGDISACVPPFVAPLLYQKYQRRE